MFTAFAMKMLNEDSMYGRMCKKVARAKTEKEVWHTCRRYQIIDNNGDLLTEGRGLEVVVRLGVRDMRRELRRYKEELQDCPENQRPSFRYSQLPKLKKKVKKVQDKKAKDEDQKKMRKSASRVSFSVKPKSRWRKAFDLSKAFGKTKGKGKESSALPGQRGDPPLVGQRGGHPFVGQRGGPPLVGHPVNGGQPLTANGDPPRFPIDWVFNGKGERVPVTRTPRTPQAENVRTEQLPPNFQVPRLQKGPQVPKNQHLQTGLHPRDERQESSGLNEMSGFVSDASSDVHPFHLERYTSETGRQNVADKNYNTGTGDRSRLDVLSRNQGAKEQLNVGSSAAHQRPVYMDH